MRAIEWAQEAVAAVAAQVEKVVAESSKGETWEGCA